MNTAARITKAITEFKNGFYASRKHANLASLEIAQKYNINGILINEFDGNKVISAIGWTKRIKVTA